MVQGKNVSPDGNLVTYNVRLTQETKDILQALAKVQKLSGGQRELIELMLSAYREKHPKTYQKAIDFLKLIDM